jgi:hypothetical protein
MIFQNKFSYIILPVLLTQMIFFITSRLIFMHADGRVSFIVVNHRHEKIIKTANWNSIRTT